MLPPGQNGCLVSGESGDKALHFLEGASKEEMALLGALAHSEEKFVILLD